MEPDNKLWHPMSKKLQHGTSGATIYHRVKQFYHRVPQFFIGLCNFSTRLQIPRVPIWNAGLHSYRRGPAWSDICIVLNMYSMEVQSINRIEASNIYQGRVYGGGIYRDIYIYVCLLLALGKTHYLVVPRFRTPWMFSYTTPSRGVALWLDDPGNSV